MNQQLQVIIPQIFELHEEYRRLRKLKLSQTINPPANAAEIAALEAHLGMKLPPAYRDFLEICNGWVGFNGKLCFLSVAQQLEGEYAHYVQQWQGEQKEYGELVPVEGLVVAIALHSNFAYLLDARKRDAAGEMEAVWWDDGEQHRYKSLFDLFEQHRLRYAALVKSEKRKR